MGGRVDRRQARKSRVFDRMMETSAGTGYLRAPIQFRTTHAREPASRVDRPIRRTRLRSPERCPRKRLDRLPGAIFANRGRQGMTPKTILSEFTREVSQKRCPPRVCIDTARAPGVWPAGGA